MHFYRKKGECLVCLSTSIRHTLIVSRSYIHVYSWSIITPEARTLVSNTHIGLSVWCTLCHLLYK